MQEIIPRGDTQVSKLAFSKGLTYFFKNPISPENFMMDLPCKVFFLTGTIKFSDTQLKKLKL